MDYRARFYAPYINHFTQPDTIVPEPGNPQALNRYSYALNNSIRYNDPTGHDPHWCTDASCRTDYLNSMMGLWRSAHHGGSGGGGENGKDDPRENNYYVRSDPTLYLLGWENFGSAITTLENPNDHWLSETYAIVYIIGWGGAHAGLLVGAAGLACVAAGPGCVQVVEGALGIGTVLGADGDPTNELYSVYRVIQNGNDIYYGMTKNPAQRFAYWNNVNGWKPEPILENLSKFDARAVEQVLIESTGLANLANKINSIAVSNPIYLDAIQRGKYLLGLP